MLRPTLIATLSLLSLPVRADEMTDKQAFIDANIRSVFYHELGHAVIDLMEVPIFGQEEDAADVMSVLLIDWLHDEDTAQAIAFDSAFGFISDPEGKEDIAYWDLHGPDEQRYYNHVCLFYGANPDAREDLASALELPGERAETCPDEYAQAANSWSAVFEEMDDLKKGRPMLFRPGSGPGSDALNRILAEEVDRMNSELKLPRELTVRVESCDEVNAYYDPEDVSVSFCAEFVDHFSTLHGILGAE